MANESWIEVRQEYEVSDTNEYILKKVTKEPKAAEPKAVTFATKDKIDLIFRIISVFAIATPIVLLYLQQKAAIRSQRALQQYDVYSSASLELHSILTRSVNEPEFKKSQDKLSYELLPKIDFLYSKDIVNQADELNNTILIYKAVVNNDNIEDSLYHYEKSAGSYLGSLQYSEDKTISIDAELLNTLNLMDSTYTEVSVSQNELKKLIKQNLTDNKSIDSILYSAVSLDSTYSFFHTDFNSLCKDIRTACDNKKNNNTASLQNQFTLVNEQKKKLRSSEPGMVDAFKKIRANMYEQLKRQIDGLQMSMREANQFLDSK